MTEKPRKWQRNLVPEDKEEEVKHDDVLMKPITGESRQM